MIDVPSLWLSLLTAVVLVLALNVYRTLRVISPSAKGVIRSGPWTARATDGSEAMTMHQRAVVACTGLWAMNSKEAIYFTALHDSNGRRLDCANTYQITGSRFPARWWSITVYRNYQLIPNLAGRHSFSMTSIIRNADESWRLTLSALPKLENWIPLGDKPGQLVISLRLYNPATDVFENLKDHPLPRIVCISQDEHAGEVPSADAGEESAHA